MKIKSLDIYKGAHKKCNQDFMSVIFFFQQSGFKTFFNL